MVPLLIVDAGSGTISGCEELAEVRCSRPPPLSRQCILQQCSSQLRGNYCGWFRFASKLRIWCFSIALISPKDKRFSNREICRSNAESLGLGRCVGCKELELQILQAKKRLLLLDGGYQWWPAVQWSPRYTMTVCIKSNLTVGFLTSLFVLNATQHYRLTWISE